ncbi:ECs1072 family phage-associated protein [Edwardsiella tarda]
MGYVRYSDLYQAHLNTIHKVRDIPKMGPVSIDELNQVKNRAVLLTTLDVVLAIHRKEHGSVFNPLQGKAALCHLLLQLYNWTGDQVRGLSLEDIIIALQKKLDAKNQPQSYQNFLDNIHADTFIFPFDDFIDEEWNPDHSKEYLLMPVE